ncbi:MAG: hypothetical protein RLZ25_2111 [Pseudomonadota bacterium]|jgi:lipoprotein-anchoring transpeptidase ErfK/SrfK
MSTPTPEPQKPAPLQGLRRLGGITAALITLIVIGRETIPFEIRVSRSLEKTQGIDPATPIRVEGIGLGTRLIEVRLLEENGTVVRESHGPGPFVSQDLRFGKHYHLWVKAERPWLHQTQEREWAFSTPVLPRIESPLNQQLDAEGRVHLEFSDPVGEMRSAGAVPFTVSRDADGKGATLTAKPGSYEQGHHYTANVQWQTPEGVALPAFEIDIGTAPPLHAEIDIKGMKNLGIAMPIEITFSEPVQDREKAASSVRVITASGETLPGKWLWYGKQRLQYRPDPYWPAFQTLEVQLQPGPARSIQGGFLARPITATFSTGSDRRIEVWLDRQRVEVFENGELIKTLKASTGKSKTPTVTGSFYIYARFPKKTMKSTGLKPGEKGYYEVKDVPYAQYFHEGYAFHGAFWHNAFGQPASHGCINLATQEKNARQGINEDAGWLYHWASLGVPVTVHETSPPKNPAPVSP